MSKYLSVFGPSFCDIRGKRMVGRKYERFGDTSKQLAISRLNIVDTLMSPKTSREGPNRQTKRDTITRKLCLFQLSSVALSQTRRAIIGKSVDFFGFSRQVSLSGWRFSVNVFLLRLFIVIRHFVEMSFTKYYGQMAQTFPHKYRQRAVAVAKIKGMKTKKAASKTLP